MDAIEFLQEWSRMCESYDYCADCDIYENCPLAREVYFFNISSNDIKEIIKKVSNWNKNNPKITYKDIVLEKFPKMSREDKLFDKTCPYDFGLLTSLACLNCDKTSKKCWEYEVDCSEEE